ncbi:MAG: head-tail adaptor protein [Clostridia bacterium]|jgi:SPP1 family predicted phage head-tail adaptor|nr:head-tail adaptor protein [Clostridia bacterium]
MKTKTGRYDRRVTLIYPSGTKVVDGVEIINYVDGTTVWAAFDVRPPKGQAFRQAETEHVSLTRWIKIRYLAGITSKWRVRYSGNGVNTVYEIVSPPIDEEMMHRDLYLEIKVVE